MSTVKARPPKFRLGDWVTFKYGVWPVVAQIVEDRGPLGAGRRRLYRIRFDQELNEPISFEMPEDEMEKLVPDKDALSHYLKQEGLKDAILRYLKQGGLVEILRTNIQGGRIQNQPKVWLTHSPRGEVSYTFTSERGLIGNGAIVPFWALHEDRILPHKKSNVLAFLMSFGLTEEEAEQVIEAVGTGGPTERRMAEF